MDGARNFAQHGDGHWAKVIGEERWIAATTGITSVMNWPFQEGRTPYTMLLVTFAGMLGVCMIAQRQLGLRAKRQRRRVLPVTEIRGRARHSVRAAFRVWANGGQRTAGPTSFSLRQVWHQSVTFISITALMLAMTPKVEAQTCSPIFFYHHSAHLGSSNVMTDRDGISTHHYEYWRSHFETIRLNKNIGEAGVTYIIRKRQESHLPPIQGRFPKP